MTCKACGSPSDVALPLDTSGGAPCAVCSQSAENCTCDGFCEEDHIQKVVYRSFSFALRAKDSFVWPAVNQTVALKVENVDRLAVKTVLFQPTAGYLHVTSFDYTTQTVLAKNEGDHCNTYTGGEVLPECTDFIIGIPPCGTGSSPLPNTPYLSADFVAPANGSCALAAVTNIQGLVLSDTTSVNGYVYRLGNIIDSTTIQLCNDGDGAPTGTVIKWDEDDDGIPNIPILVTASQNPCSRSSVAVGKILVCDGGSISRPLVGNVDQQIPVWNEIAGRFELKNINSPFTVCTPLTADLVVPTTPGAPLTAIVQDTSGFHTGDTAIVGTLYMSVAVISGTQLTLTALTPPGILTTYAAGSAVCLDININRVSSNLLTTNQSFLDPTVVNVTTNPVTLTLNNPSPNRIMKFTVVHQISFHGHASSQGSNWSGDINYDILQSIDGGGFASLAHVPLHEVLYVTGGTTPRIVREFMRDQLFQLNPGGSMTIATKFSFVGTSTLTSPVNAIFDERFIYLSSRYFGVAV